MDEPLSNLDAELRHQMRTEIRRLHDELGTTTIYVTHDQIEAMTLADRGQSSTEVNFSNMPHRSMPTDTLQTTSFVPFCVDISMIW